MYGQFIVIITTTLHFIIRIAYLQPFRVHKICSPISALIKTQYTPDKINDNTLR